jgi:phage-related protein
LVSGTHSNEYIFRPSKELDYNYCALILNDNIESLQNFGNRTVDLLVLSNESNLNNFVDRENTPDKLKPTAVFVSKKN